MPALASPGGGALTPRDSLRAVLDSVFAGPAYDWTPRVDPLHWLAVTGTVSVTVVLASLAPALRAARLDPTEALRAD